MRRAAPLACALALVAPVAALAQTPPPGEAPPLVQEPPVAEPPRPEEDGDGRREPAPAASGQLPDTGADARVIAVLGVGLLLGGIGLRLRTTDERF